MLRSLQVGRGLAAMAVLAFHISVSMGAPHNGGVATFRAFTSGGYMGVSFFFVLSGFVILLAHQDDLGRPAELRRYFARRFVRLYPPYWVYTAALLLAAMLHLALATRPPADLPSWLSTLTLIRVSPASPPIEPAWTLFHEVQFYLLFAALIADVRLGALLFTAWLGISLYNWRYDTFDTHGAWSDYASLYSLNFLLGMGAAFLFTRGWSSAWVGVGGLALLAACVGVERTGVSVSLAPYALAFALMILGFAAAERRWGLRFPALLLLIGDASYSLYLLHNATQAVVVRLALGMRLDRVIGREGVYVTVFATTVAVGIAAYLLVERPLLRRLQRAIPVRRRAIAPPATA